MNEKDPIFKEIGDRLQAIRKHLGFLQKELAAELEISTSSISEIELGNIKPRFELIYNITRKFKVNVFYLLHGEGEMFVKKTGEAENLLGGVPQYGKWLRDFLWYFNYSPVVRYAMMNYFQTYLLQNDELIEMDLEASKKEKGETKL